MSDKIRKAAEPQVDVLMAVWNAVLLSGFLSHVWVGPSVPY